MARRIVRYVEYKDDLSGEVLDESEVHKGVMVAWGDKLIALDLGSDNYNQLAAIMEPIAKAGFDSVKIPKELLAQFGEVGLDERPKPKKVKVLRDGNPEDQLALPAPGDMSKQRLAALKHGVPKDMRERIKRWGEPRGLIVASKGTVAAEITEAYLDAHPDERPALAAFRAERMAESA